MKNTRFMERLFSACNDGDTEIVNQVDSDIREAEANGKFEDDEVSYVSLGEGKVLVTDKENQEQTVIERADEENYDMYPAEVATPDSQVEGFIHPEGDGVTPGQQEGAPDEHVESHMDGESVIAPNQPDGGLNPEAGHEKSVEETAQEGPQEAPAEEVCPECGKTPCECEAEEDEEEEKEFSNTVYNRIVADQLFCERLFSEVIESEETAKVGALKIEKVEDEDAVIVTDENSGDQAKVEFEGDEMNVTSLDSKNFSDDEEVAEEAAPAEEEVAESDEDLQPLHVVGADVENHQLIDATEYDEESAQDLVDRLSEVGVDAVQVFDDEEAARDYAIELLDQLGATEDDEHCGVEEPVQAEFSDHTVYVTRYFSNHSIIMDRLFSEACEDGECPSQKIVEDAIKEGDEIEVDNAIVTPVDSKTAVIEDKENGEFTKAEIVDGDVVYNQISEETADDLMRDLEVEDNDEDEDEEKDFSDIYCNEARTKFFSASENMTSYMERLFSEEADEKEIEDAIESGEQIENDTEVITPVDAETAIIEDKENGEFTKAVLSDDDIDVTPISEDEATELTKDLEIEDKEEEKDEKAEEPKAEEEHEEEKKYSVNLNTMAKFFAEAGIQTQEVQLAPGQSVVVVDENGEPVEQPDDQEAAQEAAPVAPTVEAIEDKALAAVQSIQAAASEAEAQILNAKAAPAAQEEADLQEAQFSEKTFSNTNDTLVSWLGGNIK